MHSFFTNRIRIPLIVLPFVCSAILCFSTIANSSEPLQNEDRSIGEFRQDLKAFMKLSKSDDAQGERNAIYNLCQLHHEIVCDPRFENSQHLPSFRVVIANRLEKYSKDQRNEKLRLDREAKKQKKHQEDEHEKGESPNRPAESNSANTNSEDESGQTKDDESNTYSKTGSTNSGTTDSGDSTNDLTKGKNGGDDDSDSLSAMQDAAAEAYYSMGAASGGPNQLFDYAGQLGPPWDHGEELVDLIVNTIDPSFWRRNGGTGSIHYYQPSRVLVVSAPQQGHDEASDLLNRLRAADKN